MLSSASVDVDDLAKLLNKDFSSSNFLSMLLESHLVSWVPSEMCSCPDGG
jgi:hypothetical protein